MRCLFILFLFLNSLSLTAQNYKARFYDVKDGLISDICYTVFQDSQGFIWVGTNAGVSRFNGTEFINFDQENGLPAYSVYQIHEDSQGRIWFLTDTGNMAFYANGQFHNPTNTPFLKEMSTTSYRYGFLEDKLGQIWVGSFNDGFKVLKPDLSVVSKKVSRPQRGINRVLHFYELADDAVLSVNADSIYCYDIHNLQLSWAEKLFDKSAFVVRNTRISESEILLQSQTERIWFDIVQRKVVRKEEVQPTPEFIFFSEKLDNTFYIGSRNGLFQLSDSDISPSTKFPDLADKSISSLIKDNNGNYWASTLKSGLVKLTNYPFSFDDTKRGLYLKKEFADGNGFEGFFNGTHTYLKANGLSRTLRNYVPPNSRPFEVLQLADEQYIVFNENYVTYYENGQKYQRPFAAKSAVFDQENDELLIGQSRGVSRIKVPEFIAVIKSNDQLKFGLALAENTGVEKYANCILPYEGNFLVGTRDGLFKIETNGSYQISDVPELHHLNIMKILPQANGRLYLLSYGKGVIDYNPVNGNIRKFNEDDGLANNFLHNGIIDRDSSLWVLTKLGVSQIKKSTDQYEILNYGANEGLMNTYIQFLYEENGLLKFCSLDGEYITNAYALQEYHQKKPRIFLTKIEGFDTDQRNFEIGQNLYLQFGTISLEFGDDLSTYYRIINKNDSSEWFPFEKRIPINTTEKANLTLEVKANTRENLSSDVLSLPIRIKPTWYSSAWFRFSLLALFTLAIVYLFKNGTLKLETDQIKKTWNKLKNLKNLQPGQTELIIKVTDGSFIKLTEQQVYRITASGNYAEYLTEKGKFLSRVTMKELEDELSSDSQLKRIHRSHIVNIDHIEKVFQNNLLVRGDEIPVGHKYADLLNDLKEKVKIIK
ncbi:ligand-binding sensor domain-containing protein [Jiulongibacter sp. NS-SX5]|uniref:ligand-binding sensor domain-containing protein n=1 Tax=Jiulongibacter sp. NS-SX5 TaxID=3463854 RepID=UPI0040598DC8